MSFENVETLAALPTWTSRKTLVECVNVIQETPNVKTFQLRALTPQLFHFKPGQFIGIQLEIDGVKHNRSYTIASSPTRPHLLDLTVKLDPQGHVSPWLHQHINKGSQLELRGPTGKFNALDIPADKILMISAGSGITPMMSMARYWCDLGGEKSIRFLNWVRSVEDIIFRRELALLDAQYPAFDLEVICTMPGLSENWLGRRGRVNRTLLEDLAPDLEQRTVFCCGPEAFMEQVKSSLIQLGFDMSRYHDETFDPGGKKKAANLKSSTIEQPAKLAEPAKTGPYQLTLTRSGKTLVIEDHEILLERIEQEGINLDSSCRAGNCGTCEVKKISGETITQNSSGLDEDRAKAGYILTCTTHACSDLTLDL